ncbi:transposase (fragment) [Carnobacterium divergens]
MINKDWVVDKPLRNLTIDIPYLSFGKSMLSLSTIIDAFTSELSSIKFQII